MHRGEEHTVRIIEVDDWHWLYIDGKLRSTGHDIDTEELLEKLGVDVERRYIEVDWEERAELQDVESDFEKSWALSEGWR
jgi:hypothetical protein